MSEFQLFAEIIKRSFAKTWDLAKIEWKLHEIYIEEDPETCLCGHFPIKEICVLRNYKNNQFAEVGNCCVKKFLGLPSNKIFQAVKRIKKDLKKTVNVETVVFIYEKTMISNWERDFYIDTIKKRSLSQKQMEKRIQINQKIIARMGMGRMAKKTEITWDDIT